MNEDFFYKRINILEQEIQQYKNIEEKIGMSIATILDTLQNGYGIVVKNTQGIRRYTHQSKCYLTFGYDEYNGWYFTYKSAGMPQYFIKDYGKTWALTKEELL